MEYCKGGQECKTCISFCGARDFKYEGKGGLKMEETEEMENFPQCWEHGGRVLTPEQAKEKLECIKEGKK